jgi:thiol-disulfide isomerase/thioredoxin
MGDETDGAKKGVERLNKLAEQLEFKLQMIGKPIEVTGKLLSGEAIQWSDYLGKVVLVDFWASWCGPCRREIPNIKNQYDAYHANGFEVLGVCLDRDREKAEEYIDSAEIPWQSIFDQDAEDESMAKRYGIVSIPTAILVDREGKVVSLEARGEALPQLLARMFDPPGDPQAESGDPDDAEATESESDASHTEGLDEQQQAK